MAKRDVGTAPAKVMDLDERVERWDKADRDPEYGPWPEGAIGLLRDLIADWKRLKADNVRLRHIFSLQALDDVE